MSNSSSLTAVEEDEAEYPPEDDEAIHKVYMECTCFDPKDHTVSYTNWVNFFKKIARHDFGLTSAIGLEDLRERALHLADQKQQHRDIKRVSTLHGTDDSGDNHKAIKSGKNGMIPREVSFGDSDVTVSERKNAVGKRPNDSENIAYPSGDSDIDTTQQRDKQRKELSSTKRKKSKRKKTEAECNLARLTEESRSKGIHRTDWNHIQENAGSELEALIGEKETNDSCTNERSRVKDAFKAHQTTIRREPEKADDDDGSDDNNIRKADVMERMSADRELTYEKLNDAERDLARLMEQSRLKGRWKTDWKYIEKNAGSELRALMKLKETFSTYKKSRIRFLVRSTVWSAFKTFRTKIQNELERDHPEKGGDERKIPRILTGNKVMADITYDDALEELNSSSLAGSMIKRHVNESLNEGERDLARLMEESKSNGGARIDWDYVHKNAGPILAARMKAKKSCASYKNDRVALLVRPDAKHSFAALRVRIRRELDERGGKDASLMTDDEKSRGIHLTKAERELAWTGEKSMVVYNSTKFNWMYVKKHAARALKALIKEKEETVPSFESSKLATLVPQNKISLFKEERLKARKALSENYNHGKIEKGAVPIVHGLRINEEELALLGEESICSENGSSKTFNWEFIERHASEELRKLIEEKKVSCSPVWNSNGRINLFVRHSVRKSFDRFRKAVRAALSRGYRREQMKQFLPPTTIGDAAAIVSTSSCLSLKTKKGKLCEEPEKVKQRHEVGDKIYARWIAAGESDSWYPGTVNGYKVINTGKYGPIRAYDIHFDDGDHDPRLMENYVMSVDDYLCRSDDSEELKGVFHRKDEDSSDEYAASVGWFETDFTGGRVFSSVCDAMRVRDDMLVQKKGCRTTKLDLNLPEEWILLSPSLEGAPFRYDRTGIAKKRKLTSRDDEVGSRKKAREKITTRDGNRGLGHSDPGKKKPRQNMFRGNDDTIEISAIERRNAILRYESELNDNYRKIIRQEKRRLDENFMLFVEQEKKRLQLFIEREKEKRDQQFMDFIEQQQKTMRLQRGFFHEVMSKMGRKSKMQRKYELLHQP